MTQRTITVEYARKKLGKKAERMTDQQISDILNMLRLICDIQIDSSLHTKLSAKREVE